MSNVVHFVLLDYFFFALVFIVSITIGLYFALRKGKRQSVDEYLFGGKKLGVLPVAFSLLATAITGSSTIGQSMETYAYGLHNFMYVVILVFWGLMAIYIFLPVFYELQLQSSFTYLELRFDKSVKHIASVLFVATGFFIIPMTIYVPALSFQEVTGINLYLICIVSGCLCIWYTATGGFKAVVWTDVFQFILILLSTVIIFAVGLHSVGGFKNIWNALERGERLEIVKTGLNLETRGSLWSYLFSTFFMLAYNMCLTQSALQRYLSLPTMKMVKQAFWVQMVFGILILLMQLTLGAIIYTTYEDCDPLKAGIVKKIDQIFPHFVQEKASLFPGFNGIFIAGVFAAGLSTTSTLLNTISGTIYIDFLSSRVKNASEQTISNIMKAIVGIVGIIGISLIFLIERLGTIFAITVQCFTISAVGVFGLFCSGMIFRNINSKGAKSGVFAAMLILGILMVGSLKKGPDPVLPLRIDGCDFLSSTSFNTTQMTTNTTTNVDLPWIFRINFQFFCIIGLLVNFIVGNFVSFLTGGNIVEDQRLLLKFLRKNVPRENLLSER